MTPRAAFVALASSLLAACAATPADMRESGPRTELLASLPPLRAAQCVQRNIENLKTTFIEIQPSTVRDGLQPNTAELTVKAILVADFVPSDRGTRITVASSPYVLGYVVQTYLDAFAGC